MEPRHFPYQHPTFGTKNKPAPVSAWESSVYYWWWEYLRRHPGYKQTCEHNGQGEFAGLYSDFGDVHATDFKSWWRAHGVELFSEPRRDRILSLVDGQISQHDLDNPDLMFVMVPLYLPSKDINKKFSELLKKHHEGRRGIRQARASRAKYPVVGQPNMAALADTLKVYDYRMANPGLALWQVAMVLDRYKRFVPSSNPDMKLDDHAEKNSMSVIASRYIKKAKAMIDNAASGRFPDVK